MSVNTFYVNDIVSDNDGFSVFKDDKARIKKLTQQYKNSSIVDAFNSYYGLNIPRPENTVNENVFNLELGKVYLGKVKEFDGTHIEFEMKGIKEEILCKENFNYCYVEMQTYLNKHNNNLRFEVRSHKDNKFIVSVVNAYYLDWLENIKRCIATESPIEVHIDGLVKGGYICHTNIDTLSKLTGKTYTHSVFIPGSHIVLNIERNFDKWVGEDVEIIPQKIVTIVPQDYNEYKRRLGTGETEQSIVGSRKKVLEKIGMTNLYEMYIEHTQDDSAKDKEYSGTVTGVINSNNKKGVFVELDGLYITGLVGVDSTELFKYKPGDKVTVKVKEFETQENKIPFEFNKHSKKLMKSNTRVVFTF